MNDQFCQVCGALIPDKSRRRSTCGSQACQVAQDKKKQARWRAKKRVERGPRPILICCVCGLEVPRKKITDKTCGSDECMKAHKNRLSREAKPKKPRAKHYLKHGIEEEPHEGEPTRKCPRCGKPSYEWKYCDHCRRIVDGMAKAYTEESLLVG